MRINNSFVLLEVEKLLPVTKLIFLYGFITVTYLGLLSLYLKVLSNGTNGGGGVESGIIRSVLINFIVANMFEFILKGHYHERNKKPVSASSQHFIRHSTC